MVIGNIEALCDGMALSLGALLFSDVTLRHPSAQGTNSKPNSDSVNLPILNSNMCAEWLADRPAFNACSGGDAGHLRKLMKSVKLPLDRKELLWP
jgi:hypothetical protein